MAEISRRRLLEVIVGISLVTLQKACASKRQGSSLESSVIDAQLLEKFMQYSEELWEGDQYLREAIKRRGEKSPQRRTIIYRGFIDDKFVEVERDFNDTNVMWVYPTTGPKPPAINLRFDIHRYRDVGTKGHLLGPEDTLLIIDPKNLEALELLENGGYDFKKFRVTEQRQYCDLAREERNVCMIGEVRYEPNFKKEVESTGSYTFRNPLRKREQLLRMGDVEYRTFFVKVLNEMVRNGTLK